jgi:hypothetical protein
MANWLTLEVLEERVPFLHYLFMKIAEPRVTRLIFFGIYVCMVLGGFGILREPPQNFENVLGLPLTYMFGGFVFGGGIFSALAVLPGVWWLERTGVFALITGMLIYFILVVSLGSSTVGVAFSLAFVLVFVLRWTQIRKLQLAPREAPPVVLEG